MRRQKAVQACLVGAIAAAFRCGSLSVQAQDLKKYESNNKNFWLDPPADWFLGDETEAQKGLVPNAGQPLPSSQADLEKMLANVKLPPGFKIKVYAQGVPQARQMAIGDKGTLFVGTFDKGLVSAVVDEGGKKVAKPFITGLRMPTGVAFMNHALYVIDIDKLYKYDNPEADLSKAPEGKVVYDDMPPYVPHGWKYLVDDGKGWFYIPFGPPCNICLPPTSVSQYRHVNPADGTAETVAVGIRNSVGGAVDPRTGDLWFSENARDWMSDDMPSDKLNHVTKLGENFGYPLCHQGDAPDAEVRHGPHVLRVHAAGGQARTARGAARHEVLHRQPVPGRVQERHLHRRARLVEPSQEERLPSSSSRSSSTARMPKETVFARAAASTARRSSDRPPTSWWRPTARCWSPTTRPARSTRSAIPSSPSK